MVCQAFGEMGYDSSRNREISTARGKVRIDVHAIKLSNPIPTLVLCECKHWNKRVDQHIILSFRSVCSDVGAHYGLVISKEGFQSGATESRNYTNIHLLNFVEFQTTFFKEWRSGIFIKLARMRDSLMPLILGNLNYDDAIVLNAKAALGEKLHGVQVFEKYEVFLEIAQATQNSSSRMAHSLPR